MSNQSLAPLVSVVGAAAAVLWLGAACSVESEPNDPFGGGDAAASTSPFDTLGESGDESSDEGDGSDESSGGADDAGTFTTSASSSSTGNPGGGQPPAGMYSHCDVDAAACLPLDTCVQLMDPMTMQVVDGFCSRALCTNATVDCDPAPGGTATPACTPFGADVVCALECAGGKTCPTGMTCYNLGTVQLCA